MKGFFYAAKRTIGGSGAMPWESLEDPTVKYFTTSAQEQVWENPRLKTPMSFWKSETLFLCSTKRLKKAGNPFLKRTWISAGAWKDWL